MRLFSFLALFAMLSGLASAVPEPSLIQRAATATEVKLTDTRIVGVDPLDNMQIVEGGHGDKYYGGEAPVEQRGPEFRRWLAPSVKIGVSGASGSGTICYYDPTKNLAYVATCGHMWERGTMTEEEGRKRNITCKVIAFYHNDTKLPATKEYTAKVIFYSYVRGCDTALVTFTPDWAPEYFPIAPVNYDVKRGAHYHSVGCDGGREVAHYDIEVVGMEGADLVTRYNSPRPGRSGGGLMTDDGYYIGTCWGTSKTDGSGTGYFTPLPVIHGFWSKQPSYAFLLRQEPGGGVPARQLPIVDRNGPAGTYPKDYIPIPGKR